MANKVLKITAPALLAVVAAGFLPPESLAIPVEGASPADWNHDTFWHYPWGPSGTHKGIDIFAAESTPVLSAGPGVAVFRGSLGRGGQVVIALGVGTTGNAAGKPAHLHYSIFTPIPYPSRYRPGSQGILRPFFLNPHDKLIDSRESALAQG